MSMDSIQILVNRVLVLAVLGAGTLLGNGCATAPFTSPPAEQTPVQEASPYFERGQQFFEAGQFRRAIELWEQIPPADPNYVEAQLAIRNARLQIEQIQQEQAESLETTSQLETYITRAQELEYQGDARKALELYEEARLLAPQNTRIHEKIEELHTLLDDALERHETLGELYFVRGEYNKSKAEWERLLLIDPSNQQAQKRLADLEVLTATSDRVFYQRGRSLLKKGLVKSARAEFEKALRVNPDNQRTIQSLERLENIPFTEYTIQKGDTLSSIAQTYTGNVSDYTVLVDFNNLDADIPLKVGQTIRIPHIGRFREALASNGEENPVALDFENTSSSRGLTAPEQEGSDESTQKLFEQGVAAYNQGNYREAMQLFNHVYEREPDNQEAYDYFVRASVSLRQGIPRLDVRPEMLDPAQNEAQTESESLLQAGKALREAGKWNDAITTLERARELEPDNAEILQELEETQEELQKFITSHLNEGIKHFNQDSLENAIAEWEKVLEIVPDHEQAAQYKKRAENMLRALKSSTQQ